MAQATLPQTTLLLDAPVMRWTRAEYHRMAELGFFDGQRVELIDGRVCLMSPQSESHAIAIQLVQRALQRFFGEEFSIRIQMPLTLSNLSEPEPDVALVQGLPRHYKDHPTAAMLIVEVSDSTLAFDRGYKAALYAHHGLSEYWIVNLPERQLEVFKRPSLNPESPTGYSFADANVIRADGYVHVLGRLEWRIPVADLLP